MVKVLVQARRSVKMEHPEEQLKILPVKSGIYMFKNAIHRFQELLFPGVQLSVTIFTPGILFQLDPLLPDNIQF